MKRSFYALLCAMLMCCAFLFVSCGDDKDSDTPAHKHSYTETITKAATCTEAGEKTLTCSCGDTKTEVIPSNGHKYGEWKTTEPASCEDDGEKERECSVCGGKDTQPISHTGHNYVNDICANCGQSDPDACEHNWQDATCTTPKKCSICGAEIGVANGHSFSAWTVITPAGCTTSGSQKRECSACGAHEEAPISPNGHIYGEWTVTTPPTCGADGKKTHTCTVCGEPETVADPATGKHNYVDGVCGVCGKPEPVGCDHDWIPATCVTAETCSKCGEVKGAAKGHTYSDVWSTDNNTHWRERTCGCEGKELVGTHTFDYNVDENICTVCGYDCEANDHEHQFASDWSYDDTDHWKDAICGHYFEQDLYGEHVDADDNDVCDVCGARLVDAYDPTAKYNTYNWDKTKIYVCLNENSNNQELSSQLRRYLAGDTKTSDAIDDMVTKRNASAYATTKVEVVYTYWGEGDTNTDNSRWGASINKMIETVMANAPASPDIYCNQIYDMVSASLQKAFANIRTTKLSGGDNNFSFMEQEFVDYADAYGEEYGYMMEYMTELGFSVKKQYLIASDYFIDLVRAFFVMPLNISLLGEIDGTEVGLGDDDGYFTVDDFYAMVMRGEWTYDTLIKYAGAIYSSTSGVTGGSIDDRNGLILTTSNGMIPSALLYTTSVKIFDRKLNTETGFYECSYPDINEDLINYCAKLAELADAKGVHVEAVDHLAVREQFTNDNVLFGGIILLGSLEYDAYQDMRSSDRGGFGILPVPVYRQGDSYLTLIHNMGRIAAIAANTTEFAQCSAFIDYQSTHSSDILNEYYEAKLQYEVSGGSSGNITILNYIRKNVRSAFDKTYEDAIGFYFKGVDSQASANSWAGILAANNYKVTTMRDLYVTNKASRSKYLADIITQYDQLPE